MADTDISKMKVADLKKELKNRGKSTAGNKTELTERLQAALIEGDSNLLDESVLNDDIMDDDELNDSIKSKSPEPSTVPSSDTTQKKVILKRKLNIAVPFDNTPTNEVSSTAPLEKTRKISISSSATTDKSLGVAPLSTNVETTDKKVVKVSELTAKERLELRAKKFGTPIATESLKAARSERLKFIEDIVRRAYELQITKLMSTLDACQHKLKVIGGLFEKDNENKKTKDMVIVLLEENGQSSAVNIDPNEDLLQAVQKVKPLDYKSVYLSTMGKIIPYDKSFISLKLENYSTINVNYKLLGGLPEVKIKVCYQRNHNNIETVTLKIDAQKKVKDLKDELFKETKIPAEFIVLMRDNTELQDNLGINDITTRREITINMLATTALRSFDELFILSEKIHGAYADKIISLEVQVEKYKDLLLKIARASDEVGRLARNGI